MPTVAIDGAITVPEDTGTGVPTATADWTSAGHEGSINAQQNASNFIEQGFSPSPDFGAGEVTLEKGLAFVRHGEAIDVQDNDGNYALEWDEGVTFSASVPEVTGISLEADATNYIYLSLVLTTNNGANYVVNTDAEEPASPALLVAIVDTAAETTHTPNREPGARFRVRPASSHIERGEVAEIPDGMNEVLAGPISGEGRITGEGRLVVI